MPVLGAADPGLQFATRHRKENLVRATNSHAHAKSKTDLSVGCAVNTNPILLMLRCAPLRRRIVAVLLPTLLFALWATASYACPQWARAATQAASMAPDCDMSTSDPDQPALCAAHCVADAQADGSAPALTAAVLPSTEQPAWHAPVRTTAASRVAERREAPHSGPPLYLLLRVLRD